MELLNENNIPSGPVRDMKELMNDESLRARGTIVEVPHPQRGSFQTVGCTIKLSGLPVEVKTLQGLGEHTEEVLRELGYDDRAEETRVGREGDSTGRSGGSPYP